MTQLAPEKRWLSLAEAAQVAHRSERTMRNWVRDGVLKPAAAGIFARDAVLAAAKQMKDRRWRDSATEARVVRAAPGVWISVTPCGPHISTLNAGLVALTCRNCRIDVVALEHEHAWRLGRDDIEQCSLCYQTRIATGGQR